MAVYPKTGKRGDAVVSVEWVGASGTFENWCGARNFSLSLSNDIVSEKNGACDDWDAPVITLKSYGAQNITASMDASWTAATHTRTVAWALDQLRLAVRITFPRAEAGEVQQYEGFAMLGGLELAGIGNLDGESITENVTLEFDGTLTKTLAA